MLRAEQGAPGRPLGDVRWWPQSGHRKDFGSVFFHFSFFILAIFNGYKAISHCAFDLYFRNDYSFPVFPPMILT